MSSVGQAVGGIVGGVVGFFTPLGPVYGAQIGMMIGGVLDPPRTEGPRLEDLTAQTSVYGAFIPRLYGTTAVTGNVIWIQGDRLIEHSVESDGKGGPVVTNFEYFATFAVGLCEGPIDGVRRIWIGGQLWYDAGSDDLSTIIASNEVAATFTLYTGTDTQLADPLIQADRGAANVPAYRGLAYVVFDELPLKDYGNSLVGAQVKVEVVKNGTLSYVLEEYGSATTGTTPHDIAISGNHAFVVNYSTNTLQSFSIATGKPVSVGSVAALTNPSGVAISENAKYAYVVGGANTFRVFDITNPQQPYLLSSASTGGFEDSIVVTAGLAYVSSQGADQIRTYNIGDPSGVYLFSSIATGVDPDFMLLENGYLYVCCEGSSEIKVYDAKGLILSLVSTIATSTSPRSIAIDGGYAYVVCSGTNLMQVFDVSNPLSVPPAVGSVSCAIAPISVSVYDGYAYVVTRNNSQLQVFDVSNPAAPSLVGLIVIATGPQACVFDRGFLYVVGDSSTIKSYLFFDNKVTGSTTPLSTIVESECLQSGLLTAGDLDVTELTDQVRGYRISSLSPLRGGIDQLRKAWPFDAIQHGYKIKFKKRGGASVATITEGELDAREAGANPGVRISNVREMDLIMPQQLTVQYLDAAREYDVNVAEESR